MATLAAELTLRGRTRSVLPLVGLGVYLVTSIFYVFPSGSPQPADLILLGTIVATLVCVWRRFPTEPLLYFAAMLFICWVVLVNTIWYFLGPDFVYLKKTSFYLYNMIVFLFIVSLGFHDYKRLKVLVWWSCLIALVAQILYIELVGGGGTSKRAVGTFNNPNQLGYWGLLIMVCIAVSKERARLGFVDLIAFGAGLYVVSLSLSKAASLSSMALMAMVAFFCGWKRGVGYLLAALLILGAMVEISRGGLVDRFMELDNISALQNRLASIGKQKDDDIVYRGYYRILDNLHYIAFGAGEGDFERLDRHGRAKEFHSTLGNLFMSYGLVGIAIFLFFLAVIFIGAPWSCIFYMVPIMLYGITHNGIRFSLFWVVLGLVYGQATYGETRRVSRAAPAPADDPPDPAAFPEAARSPHPSSRSL